MVSTGSKVVSTGSKVVSRGFKVVSRDQRKRQRPKQHVWASGEALGQPDAEDPKWRV